MAHQSLRPTGGELYFYPQAVISQLSPAGVWLASSGVAPFSSATGIAPVSVGRCPPGLETRPVPCRRSLPSRLGHLSERLPWDRCPDATAPSSPPSGSRDWTVVGPICFSPTRTFAWFARRLEGLRWSGSSIV